LVNLHAVNRDLDEVVVRVEDGLDEAFAEVDEARRTLLATVRAESARLDARLAAVRSALAREGQVRRMGELYRAGELHRGAAALVRPFELAGAIGAELAPEDAPAAAAHVTDEEAGPWSARRGRWR